MAPYKIVFKHLVIIESATLYVRIKGPNLNVYPEIQPTSNSIYFITAQKTRKLSLPPHVLSRNISNVLCFVYRKEKQFRKQPVKSHNLSKM